MVFNLSEKFSNSFQEENTYVDDFIENAKVRMLGCGVFDCDAATVRNFMLPAFLVVYYKTGTVEISHGESKTTLRPGALFVFKPYEVYSGLRIGDEHISFSYMQFDITPYIQNYNLMKTAFSLDDEMFHGEQYRRVGLVLDEFLKDGVHKSGRKAMLGQLAKWAAAQMIFDQIAAGGSPAILNSSRDGRLVNQAFQYVSENLSRPIVIGDIIKNSETSKTSLERAFRNTFNLTPQQALLRFKIERSMEKLQQNQPIKNIARDLGFSSEYHFSNVFKSIVGVRPTEYRLQREAAPRL